jgi:hypothetical protein
VDRERPGGDPSRPVTIAYIAESAGVSIPTVSKVINGRSGVSADTGARIEALINEYAATEMALALGRGDPAPRLGVEIATTVTIRGSTAPPKE